MTNFLQKTDGTCCCTTWQPDAMPNQRAQATSSDPATKFHLNIEGLRVWHPGFDVYMRQPPTASDRKRPQTTPPLNSVGFLARVCFLGFRLRTLRPQATATPASRTFYIKKRRLAATLPGNRMPCLASVRKRPRDQVPSELRRFHDLPNRIRCLPMVRVNRLRPGCGETI